MSHKVARTLSLTEAELAKAERWQKDHGCKNSHLISFIFTPTSVGDTVYARCEHCKAEIDITDYEIF